MTFGMIIFLEVPYRSLEPVEITEELVRDLAESAQLTCSCTNNQPWRFVFAYAPDVLEELYGAMSRGNKWVQAASIIIAVFSKKDLDCVRSGGREYYLFDTGMATAGTKVARKERRKT